MHYFWKTIVGVVAAAVLGGCMSVQPDTKQSTQKSTFIVMKTPVFRYADQGFVHKGAGITKLEIYASGVAVMKLEISGGKVCNGTGLFSCMSREEFNRHYLSAGYPADTFEKILRGEAIFGGKNLQREKAGFRQELVRSGSYAIHYAVLNHSIVFRDTISHILIKVKENG